MNHKKNIPNLIIAILLALFFLLNTSTYAQENESYLLRAEVLDVEMGESISGSFGEMKIQLVTLRIIEEPFKGKVTTIENTLTGQSYYDLVTEPGDLVLLHTEIIEGQPQFHITDYVRDQSLRTITLLFVILLLVIAGFRGLKALISIAVMAIAVIYVILPLILQGYSPALVTLGTTSLITVMFLPMIGGFSLKTAAASIGTISGLLIAGILSHIFSQSAYLTGLSSSEAQMLQYLDTQLNFQGLLFAGIVIGALGAILDVGMSIASSMEQIALTDPNLPLNTLIKRGLNIGKDMLGTMANTLILAYLGTSMPLLLLFQAYDTPFLKIINLELIATEIIRAMAGSIGLALAVPTTAFVAGFLYHKKAANSKGD